MSTKKVLMIGIFSFLSIVVLVFGAIFGIQMSKDKSSKDMAYEASSDSLYEFNIGEMYCNLSESKRIIKINTTIETTNEKLVKSLEKKSFIIKDEINKILRNKKEEDIEGSKGQQDLQKEILSKINEAFNTKSIVNIYFDEFIVQ
ncbi:flagellar basal body-associated protein FliL [Gottschalkia purinilytica]|uniref:Flagellar protein FliL n=1 Tax=Gottschalkia purinilytica TaxID=1503 RepID=A0A0L0WBE9_GOTPU|nr:flagellar basal body-associated FliL family protein [Gottschalkia purinilytica]KNF08823.1 flagellar basal body-associated protein FliL [Gottschalkia purinilytica]